MSVNIFKNIVNQDHLKTFIQWFNKKDKLLDERPDMTSKSPSLKKNNWPKKLLLDICNKVLNEPYKIDEIYFLKQYNSSAFKIHCDSGKSQKNLYKNIIIPLEIKGGGNTIIFDNHWHGNECVFTKIPVPQYEYTLKVKGKLKYFEDIRKYKTTDKKLNAEIKRLIKLRKNRTPRQHDYSKITNLSSKPFPKNVYKKYLSHIPYVNLEGLTLLKNIKWRLKEVYTFDRTHLHTGTNSHHYKSYITIFTSRI